MLHKFKIGTVVNYRPKDRMLSTARGTYTITGLMPAIEDKPPEYRIKHFSEEFERVAFENELTAGESEHGHAMTTTPVPRTRCTKADELNGTYATRAEARRAQRRLRRVRAGAQFRYQGPRAMSFS